MGPERMRRSYRAGCFSDPDGRLPGAAETDSHYSYK